MGSGSVAESTSLNIDVRSEASDATVSGFLVIKVLEMKIKTFPLFFTIVLL